MKKLYSIQVLRAIAALAVVMFHLLVIEKKYSGGDIYLPSFFRMGQAGVDLFFVISGFILMTITYKKWNKGDIQTGEFLLHRFARIYPNYWLYFFITLSVLIIRPGIVNSSQGQHVDFLSSFLLLPSPTPPLVLVGWSLIYEVYFYIVFALLIKWGRKNIVWAFALWFLCLLIANIAPLPKPGALVKLITSPYSFEFILGAAGAILFNRLKDTRIPSVWLLFTSFIITLAFPFAFSRFYSADPSHILLQTLVFGSLFTILVVCCASLEKHMNNRFFIGLASLGDASYTIYLSHVLILGFLGRLWNAYFCRPASLWDNLLFLPVALMVIILYSLMASRIVEYPSYRLIIRLLSGKQNYFLQSSENSLKNNAATSLLRSEQPLIDLSQHIITDRQERAGDTKNQEG